MFDYGQIRKQIVEARGTRDSLVKQRTAIEARIAALDSYIKATEAMLGVMEPEQTSFIVKPPSPVPNSAEPVVREHGLRAYILQVLREADKPLTQWEIWERAHALGAHSNAEKKEDAVAFALYDLRKREAPIRRVGTATWQYEKDETQAAT